MDETPRRVGDPNHDRIQCGYQGPKVASRDPRDRACTEYCTRKAHDLQEFLTASQKLIAADRACAGPRTCRSSRVNRPAPSPDVNGPCSAPCTCRLLR